jgi:hypothetical protein
MVAVVCTKGNTRLSEQILRFDPLLRRFTQQFDAAAV